MQHNTSQASQSNPMRWHYQPTTPISVSPLFKRPISFRAVLAWFVKGWFPISEKLIILSLSLVSWWLFHPSLSQSKELALDWMSMIFLRNLGLMVVVAGGLHLYFYTYKRQQNHLQYDKRPLFEKSRLFTFNNQVKDNIFWSCASGVTLWSAFEIGMMWAMANGLVTTLDLTQQWVWIALIIFLIPIWETLYFFVIHRILHWPLCYRHVHSLHHRNTNVGPWSGLSMHPIEHVLYFSTVLIHFVIPAHPLLIIFHLQFYTLSAVTTHTGFAGLRVAGRVWLPLGTFHHQIHHRLVECNYGGLEIPMDKWFGSFHDGSAQAHHDFMEQRKRRAATTA